MGWNDVGFHGSDQIPTPNIDALAYNGIILNQHYTPALCSPSRSALLTGKYPIHTGMQHLVILEDEPWGLGLEEKLLPEVLARKGYRNHAIGKWHLGFFRKEYTPTYRGFHSHFGYWQGFQDYYNHSVSATMVPYDGYDMRRGLDVDWSAVGHYSTDLFTREAVKLIREHDTRQPMFLYMAHLAPHTANVRDPFQAPDSLVAKFAHIADPERRVYAAMVSKLDESVGEVVAALRARSMLDNSVVIFMSDNGAPTHGIHSNRGSNYPLRGIKNSGWEGGVRGIAAVWSPLFKQKQTVSNQLMYITDWMPTLCSAAGLDVKDLGEIDGIDMWEALVNGGASPRKEFVYNIDDIDNPYAAIRSGDWKYIVGSATGERNNEWYGESGSDAGIVFSPQSVMMSKAGAAISAFLIKQQIQEKIRRAASPNSVVEEKDIRDWRLLNETTMLTLRQQAELSCQQNVTEVECRPLVAPCLFNLRDDPCERVNLAASNPTVVADMEQLLSKYRSTIVPAKNVPGEESANPIYWNNTWSCWHDEMERRDDFLHSDYFVPLVAAVVLVAVVLAMLLLTPRHFFENQIVPDSPKTISVFTLEHATENEKRKGKQ
ncbi:hypothetical protein AAG570_005767 [Ranatra chinensis]|uniref:Sulfatase N-terminal domain-containing protein n=1 Tax=Ranatra chinensis TaxID=642074 RepID=A0ABD0XYE0_9HEMI